MKRQGNGKRGRFKVRIELANYQDMVLAGAGHLAPDKVRRMTIQGVVDSGAARLVLPKSVADALGLPKLGTVNVRYADQRRAKRPKVKDVWMKLLDRDGVFTATLAPKRTDALIGAIVMEELDLIVDCVAPKVMPRDPKGIVAEIE
jgi:predicted aspartyl protease